MRILRELSLFLLLAGLSLPLYSQAPSASVSGKVTDPTGALLPQALVTLSGPDGKQTTTTTNQDGRFEVRALPPGTYTLSVAAVGFRTKEKSVALAAGERQAVNFALSVEAQEEKIEVQGQANRLDIGAASNAGSVVIAGKDLEALSDDPDELESELQALAGPAAGPSGGQIYIDGFTGGQLPAKSAIREIRINQNPFSAQYDKLGYGRIEILTKPGSDHLHGQLFFNDNNAVLNSRNPYVPTKPDYNSELFDGELGGPMGKKASFFLDAQRRNVQEFSAISAITADTSNIFRIQQSIASPRKRTKISPRIDYQISPSNTLTVRYQLTHDGDENSGLTQSLRLPSQAYNLNETEHTLQISDSQILSPKVVNETRFQFDRDINHQLPASTAPTIQVQGAFTGGENAEGMVRSTEDSYELQNYTSLVEGKHLVKFGIRLRALNITDVTSANFNGTFVFSPVYDSSGKLEATALDAYQRALAGQCSPTNYSPGSCPVQYSIVTGSPAVHVYWFDAGLYAEDEWRARPNLSFTYGLRYESQNHIRDRGNLAPRLGLAWGLGSNGKGAPKTVLRAGFGMFYDRFGYNLIEEAERLDGIREASTVVTSPQFFLSNIPSSFPQSSTSPTIYRVAPELRAPYTIESAASIERQITKAATVSLTYLNSRGEHEFYIHNINAPAPFLNGDRPLATQFGNANLYQYSSGGIFRQNQLIANTRINTGRRLTLFGFYVLSYAKSNASSGGSAGGFYSSGVESFANFLSNQFDPMADYGRAAFDVRHRAFVGGNIFLPRSFAISPFVIINSGQPYNLTTGLDNNGDSIFNDRPWFTNGVSPVCTSRASFAVTPIVAGDVPINYCTGPANATLNLRLSKTIGFGRETKGGGSGHSDGQGPHVHAAGPGGGLGARGLSGAGGNPFSLGAATNRRYNLTFSIAVRNLLNTLNPSPPVGNLSSPLFGESIALAGGPFSSVTASRRVDLQVRFSF
jgi:hypothetical protein